MSDSLHAVDVPLAEALARLDADVAEFRYEPKVFGNFQLVVELGDLGLKITRDRSQYFLDLRSETHVNWVPYEVLNVGASAVFTSSTELASVLDTIATDSSSWKKRLDVFPDARS